MNGTWKMKIYGPRDVMLYDVLACHPSSTILRVSFIMHTLATYLSKSEAVFLYELLVFPGVSVIFLKAYKLV